MPRLFLALLPGPAQRSAIAAMAGTLAPAGTVQPRDDLHLTLCFLGEVPDPRLPDVLAAAATVAAPALRFTLAAADYWPRPRVLCLLPDAGARTAAIAGLADELHAAMRQAGFTPDAKPFRPHVTVLRKVPPEAAPAPWPRRLAMPLDVAAQGFALMRSVPSPGARYAVLHAWAPPASTTRDGGAGS